MHYNKLHYAKSMTSLALLFRKQRYKNVIIEAPSYSRYYDPQ